MTRTKKLESQAAKLNQEMPPGTPVRFWRGAKQGDPSGTGTIKPWGFTVLSNTTVVGWIDGTTGCIAASHIERV